MSKIWYCPPLLHILQGDLWLPKSGKGAHCNAHAFFQQNTHSPLSIHTHTHSLTCTHTTLRPGSVISSVHLTQNIWCLKLMR